MFSFPACLPGSFRHIFRGANSSCLCQWCPHPLLAGRQPSAGRWKTPICFLSQPSIQMTWADVSWLALYCRKLKIVFMSVNVPTDFTDEIIFGWSRKYNNPPFLPHFRLNVCKRPGCNGAFWRMCVQQEVRRADKVQTRKKISIKHSMLPIMRLAHNMCHRILFVERTWVYCRWKKTQLNKDSTIKLLITHWKI